MTRMLSYKAALAASVCLLPLQAFAQSDTGFDVGETPAATAAPPVTNNWVTLGGQYNSGGSAYLGRFTGAVNPGFYGLGDFHYLYRDPWDSGGTNYFSMDGANMGLPDRSFNAKIGQQGTWGLSFDYQGVPYFASPIHSVLQETGVTVPGVGGGSIPVGYGTRAIGTGIFGVYPAPANVGNSLYTYNLGTQRDIFTGSGKFQWNDWTITASMRHDHKTGYQSNSLEIGGTAGLTGTSSSSAVTSGLVYFAQPIDYDMDRYDLTAAYSAERFQAQVGYTFSQFTDNETAFNAQNPFAFGSLSGFTVSGHAAPAAGQITAPYALPPSNAAHQIKVMLGYNLSPTTRLNANFAYGLQLQNAGYLTGTGDPYNNPSLPRASFDGLVQTFYGNVAMTTKPLDKMDFRLAYTIDERDNQSPRNLYPVDARSTNVVNSDCGSAATAMCGNLPFSFQHQTMTAEAGYRILPQTKVTLNETFETTYRTYAVASFVTQNTLTAKVRSLIVDDVFGSLSYSHQDRDAHNYDTNATWNYLTPNPGGQSEIQGILMYFEASRKHDEVKGTIDVSPLPNVTATLMTKFSNDVYPRGQYGLRNNNNVEVGPDVSWQVSPALNAHAYYTFQQIYYDQSSIYNSVGTGLGPTGTGYFAQYTAKTTDQVHTLGMTLDWQAIQDLLKISLDYNLSYGDTAYVLGDGMAMVGGGVTSATTLAALNFQPLPDVTSMLNTIQLKAEYKFRPNISLIGAYTFERFTYKDYMNNAGSTQYANALLPGTLNPNDSIHMVSAAVRVRF
jgi:MtrB/PioB family decaheme-associated outer membrane protein